MTRAAQRLIVAGFEGARGRPAECWAQSHRARLARAYARRSRAGGIRRSRSCGSASRRKAPRAPRRRSSAPAEAPPAWLGAPAPHEVAYAPVAPSRRVAGEVTPERLARIEEGRLAHRLLQSLPGLPLERRRAAAEAFLARRGDDALAGAPGRARRARARADRDAGARRPVRPRLARGSPLRGHARPRRRRARLRRRPHRPARRAKPATSGSPISRPAPAVMRREYQRQLALYRAAVAPMFPGAEIRAVLLWINSGTFEELDALTLSVAFEDWAAEAASPS